MASGLYSRAAPSLRLEVKTLHLPRSTAAILYLRAHETGDGPLGTLAGKARYEDAAHVPRTTAQRGTDGPGLEAVGNEAAWTPRQARHPMRDARRGQTGRAPGTPAAL
jgi:hypothetical protein